MLTTISRALRKVLAIVGVLKLPEDIRSLWKVFWEYVLRPLLPGGIVGAVAYLQNAPLWLVAVWVVVIYVFILAFGGRLVEAIHNRLRTRQTDNQPAAGQQSELETQERWRGQDALDAYLNLMQQWIDDEEKPLATLPYDHPRRKMARTRTLTVLERLGSEHKRSVVRFLKEHALINEEQPVIRLNTANLSGANLAGMSLTNTNLSGANLSGADLSRTSLCIFMGGVESWGESIERGGDWQDLEWPIATSDLSHANLSGATFERTRLAGCNLIGACFDGADLEDADIRAGTDLRLARHLTQEQIERAYGSTGQQEYMPDTMLPDHLHAPEAWERLLSQQVRERQQSQGGN